MIEATNLKKTYIVKRRQGLFSKRKEQIEAVKEITMEIEKGKIVGLLGINGAGKTTTIKMLTTLLQPTAGRYTLDGVDAIAHPKEIKKQINMIAGGERMIYWRLTAYENLWYFGQLYGIENQVLKERISSLLKLVGLGGKEDLPVETFSKGMKQRLQIARGLINDPTYLFMDEPTIGLDAVITQELHTQIVHLARKQEKGILLTSHYLKEVEELCDYVYILSQGTLIRQGTVEELAKGVFETRQFHLILEEQDQVYEQLKNGLNRFDTEAKMTYEAGEYSFMSKKNLTEFFADFILKNQLTVREMREVSPSLEDTILKISKEEA